MMHRRDFLQMVSMSAASAALPARGTAAATRPRPNIVLMMADDMGFSDVGCYGSEIATPHINRLAQGGLRFTHFYNTARCCPTRSSLLTGLYPHQAGVGHMVADMGTPAYQGYLNNRSVTLAEVLRGGGYRTLMCGKWHVGENRPHWPTDRGFDHYFGLISGASNYWRLDEGRQMALDEKPYTPPADGFYMTDAFTDNAVRLLDQHGRGPQPFFLYLAFTSPHWPLHAHERDVQKYLGKYMLGWDELRRRRHARMIETGIVDRRWPLTPRDETAPAWETVADKKGRDRAMAVYAAQIDRMDQNVGRVLAKLGEIGAADNTLVLFLSDNGGCAEEVNRGKEGVPPGGPDSFFSYGLPWANASNTPFRLYKHWVHEGGISTPLIAHWPSVIRQGNRFTHQTGHLIDIMATLADVGQSRYPAEFGGQPITPMEGRSLRPVFEGGQIGDRRLYWEHEGNRAARDGQWKLVSRFPKGWELYDLEADRTEMHDLSAKDPGRLKRMVADYDAWAARCGVVPWDQLPGRRKAAKKSE
jgi:arylsulfatase